MAIFHESIDRLDLVLEGVKAISIWILTAVIWRAGRRFPELVNGSWKMIRWGFVLMGIGVLFDWSDEVINYSAYPLADFVQTWIEEIGLITGLILVTLGFHNWFVFIRRFLGLPPRD